MNLDDIKIQFGDVIPEHCLEVFCNVLHMYSGDQSMNEEISQQSEDNDVHGQYEPPTQQYEQPLAQQYEEPFYSSQYRQQYVEEDYRESDYPIRSTFLQPQETIQQHRPHQYVVPAYHEQYTHHQVLHEPVDEEPPRKRFRPEETYEVHQEEVMPTYYSRSTTHREPQFMSYHHQEPLFLNSERPHITNREYERFVTPKAARPSRLSETPIFTSPSKKYQEDLLNFRHGATSTPPQRRRIERSPSPEEIQRTPTRSKARAVERKSDEKKKTGLEQHAEMIQRFMFKPTGSAGKRRLTFTPVKTKKR
jgi:hypothetical protein